MVDVLVTPFPDELPDRAGSVATVDEPRVVTDNTRTALGLLLAALALGTLGDGLLRSTPWGLNVLLWVAALVAALAVVARWRGIALAGAGRWLLGPAIFFAAAFAWRDSPTLKLCNGLALATVVALAVLHLRAGRLHLAGLLEYALDGLYVGWQAVAGPFRLLGADIRWLDLARDRSYGPWLAVGRGLLLALPLLLLFGSLFAAADAVFDRLVRDLFNFSLADLWAHFAFLTVFAWTAAGVLRVGLLAKEWQNPADQAPAPRVGIVELGVVLGLLDLLFLSFVVIQGRYFFGGAATVNASAELTYAEYARRGFFELVTVAALVLPLLLLAHWALDKREPRAERRFRWLAGALVGLLFLVMASAVLRMRLYQEIYGQTELRLYTSTFMFWLAAVFAWLVATALRGQRRRFAFGALVSGLVAVALLDAYNPDADIVRTNAGRERAEPPLDACYVLSLSADAVPALVEVLPRISDETRPAVAQRLLARWSAPASPDPRTWSLGLAQAWWAVEANREALSGLAAQAPAATNCRTVTPPAGRR